MSKAYDDETLERVVGELENFLSTADNAASALLEEIISKVKARRAVIRPLDLERPVVQVKILKRPIPKGW